MDESALRTLLKSLEASWSSLDSWLNFWSALVVIGVALEIFVIIKEHREDLHEFRRGILRPPTKPSTSLLVLGLLGAALVTGGVAGEFMIRVKAGKIETDIRTTSDRLVEVVSTEAGNAKASADSAADAAERAKSAAGHAESMGNRAVSKSTTALGQTEVVHQELGKATSQ